MSTDGSLRTRDLLTIHEGSPRQHEDAAGKLVDLRDAVSFLRTRPEVDPDRVGMCGICLGGAYALRSAAFDPRVKALTLIAAAYNDPGRFQQRLGADGYRAQLVAMAEVAQRQYETGEVAYMPAVRRDDGPAGMPGREPFDYYGTERSASPHWVNQITALSWRELLTLDAGSASRFISPTPMLVIHGRTDQFLPPDDAQWAFEQAGQPKDIMWLDTTNHIDLYDNERFVAPAADRTASWFADHLKTA
jgi:uncharacterized protein